MRGAFFCEVAHPIFRKDIELLESDWNLAASRIRRDLTWRNYG
jgi:hypothetical protein